MGFENGVISGDTRFIFKRKLAEEVPGQRWRWIAICWVNRRRKRTAWARSKPEPNERRKTRSVDEGGGWTAKSWHEAARERTTGDCGWSARGSTRPRREPRSNGGRDGETPAKTSRDTIAAHWAQPLAICSSMHPMNWPLDWTESRPERHVFGSSAQTVRPSKKVRGININHLHVSVSYHMVTLSLQLTR